jgi:excinuclease ABC subunit C
VVIDGGKGAGPGSDAGVSGARPSTASLDRLGKRLETIIFADERPPLNLPMEDPGLMLLQRARDEAHRFANTFNADLRSRKLRESVLDDMPGLGAVRKQLLLKHFKGMDKLRRASTEAIQEVPGMGPKLAGELHAFLRRSETAVTDAEQSTDGWADAVSE